MKFFILLTDEIVQIVYLLREMGSFVSSKPYHSRSLWVVRAGYIRLNLDELALLIPENIIAEFT